MNPEYTESVNCPAEVYGDRACTKPVEKGDEVGWMIWSQRVVIALKLDGLWVPYSLAHMIPRFRDAALKHAA
jgi:hypothetical protein